VTTHLEVDGPVAAAAVPGSGCADLGHLRRDVLSGMASIVTFAVCQLHRRDVGLVAIRARLDGSHVACSSARAGVVHRARSSRSRQLYAPARDDAVNRDSIDRSRDCTGRCQVSRRLSDSIDSIWMAARAPPPPARESDVVLGAARSCLVAAGPSRVLRRLYVSCASLRESGRVELNCACVTAAVRREGPHRARLRPQRSRSI